MSTLAPTVAQKAATVLVVDDSDLLRNILREELEAEGYRVHQASDPVAALTTARDVRPDVILLEARLGQADGIEVCRALKADPATGHIPVLLVTSRNELKDKLAGFEAGADDYLSKPFFTKELVARLRTRLRDKVQLERSRQMGQSYLEMLFGIASAITSPFNMEDEVEVILRQALLAVGASRGMILLLDGEPGTLEVRGAHGYHGRGPRIGERVLLADKLSLGPDEAGSPTAVHVLDGEAVFVPMVAKEQLVGGIEIDLRGRGGSLSANDQKVLLSLASQAAIFIQNARLERDVRSMFLNIIVSMAGAVDAKDAYTMGHSLRVARTALVLAQQMGLSRERMEPLLLSAILHDVGKIAIPDTILKKPERLNREEFEVMKTHAEVGARMLAHIPALQAVIPGIKHHHEFWDGSGYPDGLKGEAIPLAGRIILIGDALDAMTTDRVYRKAMPLSRAMEEFRRFAGIQFDPYCITLLEEAWHRGTLHDGYSATTPTLHELIAEIR